MSWRVRRLNRPDGCVGGRRLEFIGHRMGSTTFIALAGLPLNEDQTGVTDRRGPFLRSLCSAPLP